MTFQELKMRLMSLLNGRNSDGTRRPEGGTSCYRPVRKKHQGGETEKQQEAGGCRYTCIKQILKTRPRRR